jgi:hypothetical protein
MDRRDGEVLGGELLVESSCTTLLCHIINSALHSIEICPSVIKVCHNASFTQGTANCARLVNMRICSHILANLGVEVSPSVDHHHAPD